MFFSGTRVLFRAKESMTWPTADGRIVDCSIAYRQVAREGSIPYLNLEYVFTVGGKRHYGDTLMFVGHDFSSFSDKKETVNKYPKDEAVRVRYLAADPDICVLEPGIHPQALLYPAGGLFFIVAAIVLPILVARMMNQSHVEPPNKPSAPNLATTSLSQTEGPRARSAGPIVE